VIINGRPGAPCRIPTYGEWLEQRLPPEAHPQEPPNYEVRLGPGHTPTSAGPIKRQLLRPPVLQLPPKR